MNRRRFSAALGALALGATWRGRAVAEFGAFMRAERAKWGAIVRDIGIRID